MKFCDVQVNTKEKCISYSCFEKEKNLPLWAEIWTKAKTPVDHQIKWNKKSNEIKIKSFHFRAGDAPVCHTCTNRVRWCRGEVPFENPINTFQISLSCRVSNFFWRAPFLISNFRTWCCAGKTTTRVSLSLQRTFATRSSSSTWQSLAGITTSQPTSSSSAYAALTSRTSFWGTPANTPSWCSRMCTSSTWSCSWSSCTAGRLQCLKRTCQGSSKWLEAYRWHSPNASLWIISFSSPGSWPRWNVQPLSGSRLSTQALPLRDDGRLRPRVPRRGVLHRRSPVQAARAAGDPGCDGRSIASPPRLAQRAVQVPACLFQLRPRACLCSTFLTLGVWTIWGRTSLFLWDLQTRGARLLALGKRIWRPWDRAPRLGHQTWGRGSWRISCLAEEGTACKPRGTRPQSVWVRASATAGVVREERKQGWRVIWPWYRLWKERGRHGSAFLLLTLGCGSGGRLGDLSLLLRPNVLDICLVGGGPSNWWDPITLLNWRSNSHLDPDEGLNGNKQNTRWSGSSSSSSWRSRTKPRTGSEQPCRCNGQRQCESLHHLKSSLLRWELVICQTACTHPQLTRHRCSCTTTCRSCRRQGWATRRKGRSVPYVGKHSTTVPLGTATCAFIQVIGGGDCSQFPTWPPCLRRKAIPLPLLWPQIPDKLQQARAREEVPGPARSSHPHPLDAGEPQRGAERGVQITPGNNQCSSQPSPTSQPKRPCQANAQWTKPVKQLQPYSHPGRCLLLADSS